MLDIKWIRDNPAALDRALTRRGAPPAAEVILGIDEERRAHIQKVQSAQERRNSASKEIGKAKAAKDEATAAALMAEVAGIKDFLAHAEEEERRLDAGALRESLKRFAANWLEVISSPTSIALNRIGVSQAAARDGNLGSIVLANGRFAIGKRMMPVLEAGREAGLLDFDDTETTFRTFFGLVGRDIQIRLLLGDPLTLGKAEIARDAERATDQFLTLYGTAANDPGRKNNA